MFNKLTFNLALGILVIVAIYTLTYSGITGLLMTSAVGLLAASVLDEVELIAVVTVIFAVLFITFSKQILRRLEGFQNKNDDIVGRVRDMAGKYKQKPHDLRNPRLEPAGVYDPSVEGFANASDAAMPDDGKSSKSGSAPAKQAAPIDEEVVKDVSKNVTSLLKMATGGNTTNAKDEEKKEDKKNKAKSIVDEEFESATNGLFKLGKMPSEHAEGPKLDAGKTIMKAMSSFDPKTISAMTDDTKKLLETQKGLMSMLNEMRPVLADGKELLNTFSGMFGGNSSSGLLKM